MGGVLSQLIDDKWHPVAYRSQSLSPVERNYEIHDRELLAIMRALEDWRPYLLGAMHPFEIWTDHQNLTYFKKAQKLNRRQACWHTELQEYDFTLIHKPGCHELCFFSCSYLTMRPFLLFCRSLYVFLYYHRSCISIFQSFVLHWFAPLIFRFTSQSRAVHGSHQGSSSSCAR